MQQKRNSSILSSSEKAVKIPENDTAVVLDINDYVSAEYDRKVYVGKVFEINNTDDKISCYERAGTLSIGSIFRETKKRHETWVDFVSILYVVAVPAETKQGKKFENFMLENVMENFLYGRIKTGAFFLFFLRY